MHAADGRKAVALLARAGAARDRLREALDAAGAQVVLEEDPAALDVAMFSAAAPQVALVALEPAVEDALVALEPALAAPGLLVIFDEADLAARRDGWEAQRWIRHLAAKLHGHDDVLPPGREQDLVVDLQPGRPATPPQLHAEDPFERHLVEAASLASDLPRDRPGNDPVAVPAPAAAPAANSWALVDDADAPVVEQRPARATPPPLPDFSGLELVAMESEGGAVAAGTAAAGDTNGATAAAPKSTPAKDTTAHGAVLVIAGIGGPDAVRKLITALPSDFSKPLLVQLKLDGGRYDNLVKQLARVSTLPVAMATAGDAVSASTVYVLPERVGIEARGDDLVFVDGASEPVAALPPAESAVIVLSGAEPARMDAVLALATRGGHVAGQALEGCYDATAVKLMMAGGADLGTPAQLAEQLVARWP